MLISIEIECETLNELMEKLRAAEADLPRQMGFVADPADDVALLQERLEEARKLNQGLQYQIDTLVKRVQELEAPAVPVAAGGVEVDDHGTPYDPAIHASSKKLNSDGSWRARRVVGKGQTHENSSSEVVSTAIEITPVPVTLAAEKTPTIEDVRTAIRGFRAPIIAAHADQEQGKLISMQKAREILEKTAGTVAITGLKPEQYAAVIEAMRA